jgi:hydroxyethylthiazole kinase-like sugar kinase family protein
MTVGHTELLDAWQPTVIKGNAAEIGALADSNEVRRYRNQRQLQNVD